MLGAALVPFANLSSAGATWQRFATAYQDRVTVTRAEYRGQDRELRVRATTTDLNARLSVYATNTGQYIGQMQPQGGGAHRLEITVSRNPQVITVRSSAGGEATVLVTGDNPPTVTPAVTATASATPRPTATATATLPTLRSAAINLRSRLSGGVNIVTGTVTVRDANGNSIPNASVNITWTLPDGSSQTASSSSNAQGKANFTTSGGSGVYTLTVNGIAAPGYIFDAASSVLSRRLTVP